MLIRQKAGWRLHHQAYLWPRRSRSSVLTSTSTSLRQPRRCEGAGINVAKNNDNNTSSVRRSSSSCSLEVDEIRPLSWKVSSRNRQGSEGSCDSSYPSSTSSSTLSSRKRSLSSNSDPDDADAQSRSASARTPNGSFTSIYPTLQEKVSPVPHKRRRRSSGTVSSCDEYRGRLPSRASSSHDDKSDVDVNDGDDAGATTRTPCHIRCDAYSTSIGTRRDTRKRACRAAQHAAPVCNLISYSTPKGSDNNFVNFSGSICKKSNIVISHSGSVQASSSCKESIGESKCRDSLSKSSPAASKMGAVCTKKEARQRNGSCEVTPTSIFLRSRLPSFNQSIYGISKCSSQNKLMDASSPFYPEYSHNLKDFESSYNLDDSGSSYNHHDSRSSYNIDDSGSFHILDNSESFGNPDDSDKSVMPRRAHRTSSAKPVDEVVRQMTSKETINLDMSTNLSQNGLKVKSAIISDNLGHTHQRGNRMCCFDLDVKREHDKCVTSQNSASCMSASFLSRSPKLCSSKLPPSASNPGPRHNVRGNNFSMNTKSLTTASLSQLVSNSAILGCSRTQPLTSNANSTSSPQSSTLMLKFSASSMSSLSASASQQRYHQNFTQGSESPSVGSTNSSSSSSICDKDDSGIISTPSSTPTSLNSTSLHLRHRTSSGNITQISFLQPASPLSLTPSSSKSEPLLITPSSSPCTLVNEHPLPIQSSAVLCRWHGCSSELDASDLLEHIRKHVEAQIEKKTYACFWAECKVFNKPSWSCSWLERHIVTHSGHRPFKCILDNCGQRFHSQAVLERHVNGHFTANGQTGARTARTRDDTNHRMIYKRKRQIKCRFSQTVKMNDFFDEQTMAVVKQELQSLPGHGRPDITGIALHITFRGLIIGRRSTQSGPKQSLVEFTPGDMLEDKWIPEQDAQQMFELSIPLSGLPNNTVSSLHNSLYRRHRFRKHRRK